MSQPMQCSPGPLDSQVEASVAPVLLEYVVEARVKTASAVSFDAVRTAVASALARQYRRGLPRSEGSLPLDTSDSPLLRAHLEALEVTEVPRVESSHPMALAQLQLVVLVYQLNEEEPGEEMEDGDGEGAATYQCVPAQRL